MRKYDSSAKASLELLDEEINALEMQIDDLEQELTLVVAELNYYREAVESLTGGKSIEKLSVADVLAIREALQGVLS